MNPYELVTCNITDELASEIQSVPLKPIRDGSGHAGTGYKPGWINGLMTARLDTVKLKEYPHIAEAISLLEEYLPDYDLFKIMLNRLGAKCELAQHRDGLSYNYRFHLPVITNPFATWWDELQHQWIHLRSGVWHGPIPYSGVMHQMVNLGDVARYHLVVDLTPPK